MRVGVRGASAPALPALLLALTSGTQRQILRRASAHYGSAAADQLADFGVVLLDERCAAPEDECLHGIAAFASALPRDTVLLVLCGGALGDVRRMHARRHKEGWSDSDEARFRAAVAQARELALRGTVIAARSEQQEAAATAPSST